MEILLLILKIIGMIILVLLFLFLAMILAVVFIPVRYRIKGRAASPNEIEADIVISWMFHLVHGRVQMSGSDILYKIRILGIPISLEAQKEPRRRRKRRKRRFIQDKKTKDFSGNTQEKERALKEICQETETEESEPEIPGLEEELKMRTPKTDSQAEHPPLWKKAQKKRKKHSIRQFFRECKAWLIHWKQIAVGLKNKTITWKQQFVNIKNTILEETNKNAVICLFREFRYLLKHFSPRKASGTLQYGTQDPAITGQILGIISLFPFWYRYQISVQPDFTAEDFYARGCLALKGRIRALHMLRTGIRLIKDKNIRRLINQIRK